MVAIIALSLTVWVCVGFFWHGIVTECWEYNDRKYFGAALIWPFLTLIFAMSGIKWLALNTGGAVKEALEETIKR